jgi:hypothetical protein
MTKPLTTGRVINTPRVLAMPASQRQRLEEVEARLIFEADPAAQHGMGRRVAVADSPNDAQLLIACWNASRGDSCQNQLAEALAKIDVLQRTANGHQGALQRAQDRWFAAGKDRKDAERQRDELLAAAQRLADLGFFSPVSCASAEQLAAMTAMSTAITSITNDIN